MSLPSKMLAITYTKPLTHSLTTIPLPPLRPTHLLIKVSAVALNPTDWKHATYLPGAVPFSTLGCDYAGTVISIGSRVTKRFEIGQRVYGCAHGANQSNGSDGVFAEYAVVKGDTTMRAPVSSALGLGMDDLATVALGSITVGQGLFQPGKGLGLSMPGLEPERENENENENGEGVEARAGGQGEWLLIYGGSTATGTLAIQFAKLAGYRVVTTCSPAHNGLVRARGADAVFDYRDVGVGGRIRSLTENGLRYAWDTTGAGRGICDEALSSDSGSGLYYGSILEDDGEGEKRGDVKRTHTLMYTMFGERFVKGGKEWEASADDYGFAKAWMGFTERVVGEGKLVPHPKRVGTGGLEGVLRGMEELKEGRVRGEKLVYFI